MDALQVLRVLRLLRLLQLLRLPPLPQPPLGLQRLHPCPGAWLAWCCAWQPQGLRLMPLPPLTPQLHCLEKLLNKTRPLSPRMQAGVCLARQGVLCVGAVLFWTVRQAA